jgi:ABC-type uncharacterized transport system substrate-binding protein
MKRIAVLLFVLGLPFTAMAQQGTPVIGYLGAESAERFASRLAAFRRGLAEMNYAEGRNVIIEYRWANGDNSRLPELAAELVRKQVSVLAAPGSAPAAFAAKKATAAIPVVFEVGIDPVAGGLVASMSRPGGNATGVTSLNTQVMPKRLELLRELLPRAASFALLVNPTNPKNAEAVTKDLQAFADANRLQLHVVRVATEQDLAAAFETLSRLRVEGLAIANDPFFVHRSKEIAAMAWRKRIPAAHLSWEFVAAGGLISYAGDYEESHRLAGVYAGRVLRGDKPADLPVQQVSKTLLFVNVKTAKALGIAVPSSVLLRADRVIE